MFWSFTMYMFESLAECIAIWVTNKVLGILVYLSFWILSFLFGGTFVDIDELPPFLQMFYYVTPFGYYCRSAFYILYNDATFEPCDSKSSPSEPVCVRVVSATTSSLV